MHHFDLTMPLDHNWMPDEVFPTATQFVLAPRDHPERLVVGSETGTCLTLPAEFAEFRKTPRLHEVPVEKLFLRPTTVADIQKKHGETITVDDLQTTLKDANPQEGDALLIRTGWGDSNKYAEGGSRYILESPHFSLNAARLLASEMADKKSDLLLTDCALIGWPDKHLIPEWCTLKPRPAPWPSPEARVYLHLYSAEKAKQDFAVELAFARAGIMTVKRLIHCSAITAKRIRIIVSPLHIVRGVSSTCRVVAVQEARREA